MSFDGILKTDVYLIAGLRLSQCPFKSDPCVWAKVAAHPVVKGILKLRLEVFVKAFVKGVGNLRLGSNSPACVFVALATN